MLACMIVSIFIQFVWAWNGHQVCHGRNIPPHRPIWKNKQRQNNTAGFASVYEFIINKIGQQHTGFYNISILHTRIFGLEA